MNELPLVSIVIPVFNGSNFMAEAIDSALAQAYPNIEILVINDGSSDEGATHKIALSYGDKIKYFEKKNGGVASALNLGIKEMNGKYFSWLSHDDVYKSHKIQTQVDYLETNENIGACYSNYDVIDEYSNFVKSVNVQWFPGKKALLELFGNGYINGCSLLISKTIFDKVGLFNEELLYSQDIEMWIRILNETTIGKVEENLFFEREHKNQGSIKFNKEVKEEVKQMYSEIFISLSIYEHLNAHNYSQNQKIANGFLWLGDRLARYRGDYIGALFFYQQSLNQWDSMYNKARIRKLLGQKGLFFYFGSLKAVHLIKKAF
ncbi:MAG: glycosyltransferase [Ignavibacteria bacterium]|nr:glycosyltransferase [Ignavibacteria bacterium]